MIKLRQDKPENLEVGHLVQFIDADLIAKGEPALVYGVITDWFVDMTGINGTHMYHFTILHILDENREAIYSVAPYQIVHVLGEMTISAINIHQSDRFKKYRVRHPLDPNGYLDIG